MKEKIEELKGRFQKKMTAAEDYIKQINSHVESSAGKTKADIEAQLEKAKVALKKQKAAAEEAGAKVEAKVEAKVDELKEKVADKKQEHALKKAEKKADKAEAYAENMIAITLAAACEAEVAVLEAIAARLDVEEMLEES